MELSTASEGKGMDGTKKTDGDLNAMARACIREHCGRLIGDREGLFLDTPGGLELLGAMIRSDEISRRSR